MPKVERQTNPSVSLIFTRFKDAYRTVASRDGEWAAHNVWQALMLDATFNGNGFESAVENFEKIARGD